MLPWPDMLRAALMLGLGPAEFWACSLREWRWLTRNSPHALDRGRLEQLIQDYPDTDRETRDGAL